MNEENLILQETDGTEETEVTFPVEEEAQDTAEGDVFEENSEKTDQASELEALRLELEGLKAELKRRDELDADRARVEKELEEFMGLYPESDVRAIPEDVWLRVREGIPLAAAFALYQRKSELEKKRIGELNEKNRKMSSGSLNDGETESFYSPSEVRKMTPQEVKKNYDDIIRSMRHWN